MQAATAADVADMRRAIAQEKGEDDFWDLKYAAGGTVDIDFIAQYLQLVHAADKPEILNVATTTVIDNAARLGVLAQSDAEVLRAAVRLYHDLTQIIRLCVSGKFNPATAGVDLLRVMARAGDTPRLLDAAGAAARDASRGAAGVYRCGGLVQAGTTPPQWQGETRARRGAPAEHANLVRRSSPRSAA